MEITRGAVVIVVVSAPRTTAADFTRIHRLRFSADSHILPALPMTRQIGARLGAYEIISTLGSGGPASVRIWPIVRELRRGLAEAKEWIRP